MFFLGFVSLRAQRSMDDKLAIQFYEQKQYDKAITYFDKLFDKLPDVYFNYYYNALIEVKDYKTAEKITKKQIKRNASNSQLYVKLGRVYLLMENPEKGKEQYEKAIKSLIPEQNNVFTLAHAFEEMELIYILSWQILSYEVKQFGNCAQN